MIAHSRQRRLAGFLVLATGLPLLFAGFLAGASSASEEVIPSAITSINTTARTVSQWDLVNFTCTWAVPDHHPHDEQRRECSHHHGHARGHGL